MESTGVFIYGLVDPRDGQLRYVGQTVCGLRTRMSRHLADRSRSHRANWIGLLRGLGLKPQMVVIQEFADDELLSQAEIHWIAYFKALGFPLVNQTVGGEGTSGHRDSSETRERKSLARLGKKHSVETRAKISLGNAGKTRSGAVLEANRRAAIRHAVRSPDGTVFESVSAASRATGMCRKTVRKTFEKVAK